MTLVKREEPATEITDDPEFRGRLQEAVAATYEIEKLIGEGGFGRVYSARDIRLDRRVAIKVIKPDLAGARMFSDRFRKEAMALAKFRHPGIIPIYDIQDAGGLTYFVMPLIEGDSLRARLQRHRTIAPQETRRLLVELCQCLSATHRVGIIHRDIKPDNVMLEADALARALLMDFGIAKSTAELTKTNSGMMLGTPTYMSPEQMNGDVGVDARSDIYSLGVLGYHMLTGRPPFVGSSWNEVVYGHLTRPAEPLRKLNPSVPGPLADVVMRCLSKDPNDRFQSAGEMAIALNAIVFMDPAGPSEGKVNYAFPFFAGMVVVALAVGMLGPERLGYVHRREWMWISGGLAVLAIMCSPIVRVTTDLQRRRLGDWWTARRRS